MTTRQALGNSDVVSRRAQPEAAAPGPTGDEMNPNPFLHPQEQKT